MLRFAVYSGLPSGDAFVMGGTAWCDRLRVLDPADLPADAAACEAEYEVHRKAVYYESFLKKNGYDAAQNSPIPESKSEETEEKPKIESDDSLKKLLMKFSFIGRINRTEYIISVIICVILIFVVANVEDSVLRRILGLVIDVFLWSQCARRLHDFGASGWYVLIPVVSWIFAAFPKGDKGENEYGVAPK